MGVEVVAGLTQRGQAAEGIGDAPARLGGPLVRSARLRAAPSGTRRARESSLDAAREAARRPRMAILVAVLALLVVIGTVGTP